MKKILVGYIEDFKHSGIDKYLLNVLKVANENNIKLDFLTSRPDAQTKEMLKAYDSEVFTISSLKKPVSQYNDIKRIIKQGDYKLTYFNISEAFNCVGLAAAKSCKVPVRIVHSHSAGVDKENKYARFLRITLNNIFKIFISSASTKRLACSSVAGKWLFNNDFEIIYNAIDAKRFAFSQENREKTREELKLGNKNTFIHIGNFCYQKNHLFLMDVFRKILEINGNSVLLSIGVGNDLPKVREYVKSLGIEKNVIFLGVRNDISELFSASDALIFPSNFEGLGIVSIEAQFSGIPCLVSTNVPQEAKISDKFYYLPLKEPKKWALLALEAIGTREEANLDITALNNYDIANQKHQIISVLRS